MAIDLVGVAEHALATLRRLGVQHAEVSVGTGRELEVSVREGEVELVKEASSSGLSVRVIVDDKVATSSTTDLKRSAVEEFLRRAIDMAAVSEADPLAAPPEPSELSTHVPKLELFDPRVEGFLADDAIAMARTAEQAAFGYDPRISSSEGASFSRSSGRSVLATSGGFLGQKDGTYVSLSVQAIADDEGGKKRNGSHWTGSRFLEDLEDPAAIGLEAAKRAVASLGAKKLETGVYPIVFDKDVARAIVGLVASCILGDAVYRQRSYLAEKLGQAIGSRWLTIVDDPFVERGPGSRTFDGEGRPVSRRAVVEDGTLKSFLLDTYSARKLGLTPTGSANGGGGIPHSSTSNLYLVAGDRPAKALLQGIERGLFVQRMMGFGFDPVTGNFSRGAEGFLIEGGQITRPIGEITISRNLDGVLHGITAVADDLSHKTATSSPSFLVDEMTVAGA